MGTTIISNLSTLEDSAAAARVSLFMAGNEYALYDAENKRIISIRKEGNKYTVIDYQEDADAQIK